MDFKHYTKLFLSLGSPKDGNEETGDDSTQVAVAVTGIAEAGGWNGWSPCQIILSNSRTRAAAARQDNQKGAGRTEGEKEEKGELLIVWFLRRNMSDILLSMKLSCKSLSAPVVHTDKASCTKNPLQRGRETVPTGIGNKEMRQNS